jgi:hypothetical protein
VVQSVEVVTYIRYLDAVTIKGLKKLKEISIQIVWYGQHSNRGPDKYEFAEVSKLHCCVIALLFVTSKVTIGWTAQFCVTGRKYAKCERETTKQFVVGLPHAGSSVVPFMNLDCPWRSMSQLLERPVS